MFTVMYACIYVAVTFDDCEEQTYTSILQKVRTRQYTIFYY